MNPRNCKGSTEKERKARRKLLCYRFYAKNFLKRFWVDPDSKRFDREYDVRTLSEQGFSVGKGSLNLDTLRHRGIEWATLHSMCICVADAGGGEDGDRDGKTRPDEVCQMLQRIGR